MRIVRFRKSYDYSEGLVKQYDFFDTFLQTGFYGAFLALGQILAILTMNFYPYLEFSGVFGWSFPCYNSSAPILSVSYFSLC